MLDSVDLDLSLEREHVTHVLEEHRISRFEELEEVPTESVDELVRTQVLLQMAAMDEALRYVDREGASLRTALEGSRDNEAT